MAKATSSAPSQRMLRVGEQVRAALTQILQRGEVRDDLIESTVISISEVRMSPDLKIATAYVTPLGVADHTTSSAPSTATPNSCADVWAPSCGK